MRNIFKKSLVFFCLLFCLSILDVKAYEDYTIDKFDIDIKVNEDNSYDVKENIDVYFNVPSSGIYREIPLENEIIRFDGSSYKNKAQVSNIKVNEEFSTNKENKNYVIKIGSEGKTLTGLKEYEISYHYNMGNDRSNNYDELYYNLIGTWDTSISNISFRISMPKEFDESKLKFFMDEYEEITTSDISYQVEGNVITGMFNRTLSQGEGLIIRLELPDGYFVKQKDMFPNYLIYIIIILCLIIAFILYFIFGKTKNKNILKLEFYPPNNFNSLEVGNIYKGKADNKDVLSLMIYLANKGYIKIFTINNNGSFKIIKVKDYDGDNDLEFKFLRGLDIYSKLEMDQKVIYSSSLVDEFYKIINDILKDTNKVNMEEEIIDTNSVLKTNIVKIIMIILSIIPIALAIFVPSLKYNYTNSLLFVLIESFSMIMIFITFKKQRKNFTTILGVVFIPLLMIIIFDFPIINFIKNIIREDSNNLFSLLFSIIVTIIIIILRFNMKYKKTDYGNEILEKIKGFKNFIETAKKDKLEQLVNENPNYFYDILPYAYVLGVFDIWIKKFETIAIQSPNWYNDGSSNFYVKDFGDSITRTMNYSVRNVAALPSSTLVISDNNPSNGSSSSIGGSF